MNFDKNISDMEEDYQFEQGDSGSSDIEKIQAGCLKKGSLVMIKGHPCKVMDFSTAKTGKHGAAKAMSLVLTSSHPTNMSAPSPPVKTLMLLSPKRRSTPLLSSMMRIHAAHD
jgi:hypothetical protein